jgi:nickel-dependent lactate racemase
LATEDRIRVELPYGREGAAVELPRTLDLHEIAPAARAPVDDPSACVGEALDTLVGCITWEDFAGLETVAIAVNDKTRPVPHNHLLSRLERAGFVPESILLLIATGTHPPMTSEEFPDILPREVIERYRIVSHDAYDRDLVEQVGATSRGTPMWINRQFLAADLRIVVGNIEPHQFMGYSGGVKSAVIGLAGHQTVDHNHAFMSDAAARLGNLEGNPTRSDVEEMGSLIRVDLALNAVLNSKKQLVDAVAGRPAEVMRAGVEIARSIFEVTVPTRADMVIASPGGHPKDINLYQAQKALAHANLIAKPGAPIVLLAACPDGTGSEKYENWVRERSSHEDVLRRFSEEGFRVGPHKAFQISRDAVGRRVFLVSEMEAERVRRLLLEPAASAQAAVDSLLPELSANLTVAVMPVANATVPRVAGEGDADTDGARKGSGRH